MLFTIHLTFARPHLGRPHGEVLRLQRGQAGLRHHARRQSRRLLPPRLLLLLGLFLDLVAGQYAGGRPDSPGDTSFAHHSGTGIIYTGNRIADAIQWVQHNDSPNNGGPFAFPTNDLAYSYMKLAMVKWDCTDHMDAHFTGGNTAPHVGFQSLQHGHVPGKMEKDCAFEPTVPDT